MDLGRDSNAQQIKLSQDRRNVNTVKQRIWLAWEKGMEWIMGLRCEHTLEFGICKVLVKKYSGVDILCKDGTLIKKGDRIGELHLSNQMVLALTQEVGADRAALQTARQVRASLKAISKALESRMEMMHVRAVVGVTLLHRGLTHGLGFEEMCLPSKRFEKLTTFYLRLLLRFMHPEGIERINRSKEKLTPLMLIYTRSALIQKFDLKPKMHWYSSYPENFSATSVISL